MSKPILWIDLETTGSDAQEHSLIEIGAVVTDDTPELTVIDHFTVVIKTITDEWVDAVPVVLDMHTKNGLLVESLTDGVNYPDAVNMFADWVNSFDWRNRRVPLAGSGVGHFDRVWLDRMLDDVKPEFPQMAYWSYDIGCVRRFARLGGLRDLEDFGYDGTQAGANKPHRALDDIFDHIAEARAFISMFAAVQAGQDA